MPSIIGQTPKVYGESNIFQSKVGGELLSVLDFSRDYPLVLDVGSGTGNVAKQLAPSIPGVKQVWGIDIDAEMVNASNKENEGGNVIYKFYAGDISNPFMDLPSELKKVGRFDLIISNLALHWIDPQRRCQAFENMTKLLKKGGVLTATIFCPRNILQSLEPADAQLVTSSSNNLIPKQLEDVEHWSKLAESNGLKILKQQLLNKCFIFKLEEKEKIQPLVDLGVIFYLKNLGLDGGERVDEKIKNAVAKAAKASHLSLVESEEDVIFSQETVLIHCCK